MSSGIEVVASIAEEHLLPISASEAEEAVRHVLAAEGVTSAEISLAFVRDEEIARLNQRYLSHPGATDVISFALHADGERPLGDVYIGAEQAARQAEELGASPRDELLRLTIHGTLHVLGYDHPAEGDRDRSPMYLHQEELLASILDRFRADGR